MALTVLRKPLSEIPVSSCCEPDSTSDLQASVDLRFLATVHDLPRIPAYRRERIFAIGYAVSRFRGAKSRRFTSVYTQTVAEMRVVFWTGENSKDKNKARNSSAWWQKLQYAPLYTSNQLNRQPCTTCQYDVAMHVQICTHPVMHVITKLVYMCGQGVLIWYHAQK